MKFRPLIPKMGWIRKYTAYAAGSDTLELPDKFLNEIPFEFHLFVGLTIISAVLKRNVYLDQGTYKIWPSMLTFIVAPSGAGKKGTAIKMGTDILQDTGITKVLSERMSPEALIVALKNERPTIEQEDGKIKITPEQLDSTALIVAPELATLFNKAEHNQYMFPLLTRFADCPDHWSDQTIGRGYNELHNVAVTLLGASAPAWLLDGAIPTVAFGGGFVARSLIIVRMERTAPVPRPQPLCEPLRDELTRELFAIANLKLKMKLDKETGEFFDAWYIEGYHKRSYEEKRAAYHERKPDHVLRTAMLIAVSKLRPEIQMEDLKEAIAIIEEAEKNMYDLFGTIERTNTVAGYAVEKILRKIKARGRIKHADLMRAVVAYGLHREEVANAIDMLEQGNIIEVQKQLNPNAKRMVYATYYKYLGGENDEGWTGKDQKEAENKHKKGD